MSQDLTAYEESLLPHIVVAGCLCYTLTNSAWVSGGCAGALSILEISIRVVPILEPSLESGSLLSMTCLQAPRRRLPCFSTCATAFRSSVKVSRASNCSLGDWGDSTVRPVRLKCSTKASICCEMAVTPCYGHKS